MSEAVWIYGVEDGAAAGPPPGRGVDPAHPVELVRHAGLAALTSRVNGEEFNEDALREALEDLDRLEALARAHERVLDDALTGGAIVPFRICTIYSSEDSVREMLERERKTLADALGRLRGKSEWGVKAFAPEAARPPTSAPASGAEFFARKRAERTAAESSRRALEAATDAIHERLAAETAGAVLSPPQERRLTGRAGEMVLNAAYLVTDADVAAFRKLIAELERTYGVPLEVTGPWPAYHFSR
jgi:hypothetical protein